MRLNPTPEHRHTQNADHLAHKTPFSAFFTEVVCDLGATPPQVAASSPSIGGICNIRDATRRRHADSQLLMLQTPTATGVEGTEEPQDRDAAPAAIRGSRVTAITTPAKVAHNFPRSFFETARKRCNSNDANSMFEQAAGELRAKLMGGDGAGLRCPWAGARPGRTTSRRARPRHISHIISPGHF